MKKFKEKKKFSEIMQSKPILIILGILIIAFGWSVFGLMNRMEETAKNKKIEEDKITELKQRKDTLTSEIAKLKTEKGVEENIREKFGWVKDGEDMIVVVDDNEQTNSNNTTQVNGFLSFFRKIFK